MRYALPVQAFDVFPDGPVVKDTGDCWEPLHGRVQEARRIAARYSGYADSIRMIAICENSRCIHPDHLSSTLEPEGRLLYIKQRVESLGECLLWTGKVRSGKPAMPMGANGNTVSVQRYVYSQEYGCSLRHDEEVRVSCGNDMCVNHRHIAKKEDDNATR